MTSQDKNKKFIMGLLNIVCEKNYEYFTEIEDNGINYIFKCVENGENVDHIISKEFFDECIDILNKELFGVDTPSENV